MKKMTALILMLAICGCTSRTQFGECIGLGEDMKPDLKYKLSGWNIAMGIIFSEIVIPPIMVAVGETFCPVSKK